MTIELGLCRLFFEAGIAIGLAFILGLALGLFAMSWLGRKRPIEPRPSTPGPQPNRHKIVTRELPPPAPNHQKHDWTMWTEKRKSIRIAILNGMSSNQIAETYHCSHTEVARVKRKLEANDE
jgi:hypothetical protein